MGHPGASTPNGNGPENGSGNPSPGDPLTESPEKTFSSRDVVRIACKHLDQKEAVDVLIFFWLVLPAFIGFSLLVPRVLGMGHANTIRIAFNVLERLLGPLQSLLLDFLLPPDTRAAYLNYLLESEVY